ncbi:hypothetical protein [Salinibaculum rarum]|uniref:hypothetical protein n=1 Tax=Salinibaculum rarum TaxID=3058903 RepID=UPI00265E6EFA|nr:hypothetical protein [Salinibaculum sp. KK48]
MDHLSSCYFCGGSLDTRLQEYAVVPEPRQDDGDATTATLCPACRQKLETVLDAVLDGDDISLSTADDRPSGAVSAADDVDSTGSGLDETASAGAAAGSQPTEETASADESETAEEPELVSGDEMWDSAAEDVDADETAESAAAEATDEEDEWEELGSEDDGGSEGDDDADDEPVTADDVAALAGDIDPSILEDDDDDTDDEDDELQSAMEADVPDAFDTTDDTESASETDDVAAEDTEPESETDDVTAEDVEALAGDIDSSILEDDEDESQDDEDERLRSAMTAEMPAEFQGSSTESGSDDAGATEPDPDAEPAESDTADVADDVAESETAESEEAVDSEPTASEEAADSEASESETTTDEQPARTNISALEYNKVMRLLQNREFPVARDEIETVAANAYDLSQTQCAEVIDLAVDRGLIDEDGDQLVRSE